MKVKTPAVGMICVSTQGRDKGNVYAVQAISSERFVLVVDGIRAKLDSPKRKNLKHLSLTPKNISEYGVNFSNGKVYDCNIAYALKRYIQSKI